MAEIKINEKQLIEAALTRLTEEIFTKSQENLIEMNKVDTGFLMRSGNIEKTGDYSMRIVYTAPYAPCIEYGTAPHTPPFEAIQRWVERKLGKSGKDAKRTAYFIVKKIEKQGTKPYPFLRNAIEYVKNR